MGYAYDLVIRVTGWVSFGFGQSSHLLRPFGSYSNYYHGLYRHGLGLYSDYAIQFFKNMK